jgi:hypothetical protein
MAILISGLPVPKCANLEMRCGILMFVPGKKSVLWDPAVVNGSSGAGSVNLNYRFGFGTGSGSFVFIQDSKKFQKKVQYRI